MPGQPQHSPSTRLILHWLTTHSSAQPASLTSPHPMLPILTHPVSQLPDPRSPSELPTLSQLPALSSRLPTPSFSSQLPVLRSRLKDLGCRLPAASYYIQLPTLSSQLSALSSQPHPSAQFPVQSPAPSPQLPLTFRPGPALGTRTGPGPGRRQLAVLYWCSRGRRTSAVRQYPCPGCHR